LGRDIEAPRTANGPEEFAERALPVVQEEERETRAMIHGRPRAEQEVRMRREETKRERKRDRDSAEARRLITSQRRTPDVHN